MGRMSGSYWKSVLQAGLDVPQDRPLGDITTELTRMLGDPDPELRDGTAYPLLATWIERGVYDDLLAGLGDGMAAGLTVGLGESGTDSVLRRSFSVLVLAECIERDNRAHLLPGSKILDWGDRLATWYLRERDLRGFVPGKGWAHAIAHGADALAALARSRHLVGTELTVLLDVIADRILDNDVVYTAGEPDRIAFAVMAVLRRNMLPLSLVEPWLARIASGTKRRGAAADRDPFLATGNPQALLRALYLQLQLGSPAPDIRSDLLLSLVATLKASNPQYLSATPE